MIDLPSRSYKENRSGIERAGNADLAPGIPHSTLVKGMHWLPRKFTYHHGAIQIAQMSLPRRTILWLVSISLLGCGLSVFILRGFAPGGRRQTPFTKANHKMEAPYYEGYRPEVFENLDKIPSNVAARATSYLRTHLATVMLKKLSFKEGCRVERAKLAAVGIQQEANLAYVFIYTIHVDSDTVENYDIAFCIDDTGKVLSDARLPPMRNNNEFAVATKEQILQVARRELGSWKYAELTYNSEKNIWAWRFIRMNRPIPFIRGESMAILEIDASSGAMLSKREISIMR